MKNGIIIKSKNKYKMGLERYKKKVEKPSVNKTKRTKENLRKHISESQEKPKKDAEEIRLRLLEEIERRSPYPAYWFFDEFFKNKHQPFAREVAVNLAEKYPIYIFAYIDKFLDTEYAEEVITIAGEIIPKAFILDFEKYKDEEFAEKLMRNAAEIEMKAFLLNLPLYSEKPYMEEILRDCLWREPKWVINSLSGARGESYVPDLLNEAIDIDPIAVIRAISRNSHPEQSEFLLKKLAEIYPEEVFKNLEYRDTKNKYVSETIKKIFKEYKDEFPWIILKYSEVFQNDPGFEDELEIAIAECIELREVDYLFEYIEVFADKGYAKHVVEICLEADPAMVEKLQKKKKLLIKIYGTAEQTEKLLQKHTKRAEVAKKYKELAKQTVTRKLLKELTPDAIAGALSNAAASISFQNFNKIFFSKSFQKFLRDRSGKMSFANAFSFVTSIARITIKKEVSLTEKEISAAIKQIWERWEAVKERELFGPQTKLILFSHSEERFSNKKIIENIYKRSGGTDENLLCDEKGKKGKNKILKAMKDAKGNTTILFDGHGTEESLSLSSSDSVNSDIDYEELGKALVESGNMKNFNLVIASCYGYDFIENLYTYLEESGVTERPSVSISSANKNAYSYSGEDDDVVDSKLLIGAHKESDKGKSIKVKHIFEGEKHSWEYEDPSIKVGNEQLGFNKSKHPAEEIARSQYSKEKTQA